MQGFIGYSYSEFRLYVDNELTADNFIHEGVARTTAPEVETGDIKIATFNVLNYFNSDINGAENPFGDNRGAESEDDLVLQTKKIVKALIALDADFVGLMEVENNGFGENSAIVALVTALNLELDEDKQYTIASSADYEYIGTDAITNNAIYRANKLSLDSFDVIEMPQQHVSVEGAESADSYMRDAVTPTFTVIGTDKKLTISVNHLKSKGSTCYEDVISDEQLDDTDLQGSCENFRVSGAYELAEKLAEKGGYTMIVGDLNSYGSEDAILLLTNRDNAEADYAIKAAAYTYIGGDDEELGEMLHGAEGATLSQSYGYVDTLAKYEEDGLSYSYNDEVGTLDYILVNESLSEYVVDAAHWNINSVESEFFQYDYSYGDVEIYDDAYRSSDHDPAIVVLDFNIDSALGESITLPSTPIDKPAQTTTITDGVLGVVVDLTSSSESSLQIGTSVTVSISEVTETRSITSQSNTVTLTEEQITQGWVNVDVKEVSAGTVSVASYIGTELVSTNEYALTAAESDSDSSGGSTSIFSLLSLLGFAGWRLARRK
jgi:predicted extracellular nuclease